MQGERGSVTDMYSLPFIQPGGTMQGERGSVTDMYSLSFIQPGVLCRVSEVVWLTCIPSHLSNQVFYAGWAR